MKVVSGTFNGTASDLYLCIGFIPDCVTLWNLEDTARVKVEWNAGMTRALEVVDGIQLSALDQQAAALTTGTGVKRYYGGTVLAAADVGTTTFGSVDAIYLKPDYKDYRYPSEVSSPHGLFDAVSQTIDTWTKGTVANKGNFNDDVTGTYIGEGSPICIDGKWYSIVGLSSGTGISADEVTLDQTVSSGVVQYIGGMYSTIPMIAGETTKNGFIISNTTLNASDKMCAFVAGNYSL